VLSYLQALGRWRGTLRLALGGWGGGGWSDIGALLMGKLNMLRTLQVTHNGCLQVV
jgi:hypothetical protein